MQKINMKAPLKQRWWEQAIIFCTRCGRKCSWEPKGARYWRGVLSWNRQDNQSVIKMEKKGKASAGPRSQHIDIRYFWIKDRTKASDILI